MRQPVDVYMRIMAERMLRMEQAAIVPTMHHTLWDILGMSLGGRLVRAFAYSTTKTADVPRRTAKKNPARRMVELGVLGTLMIGLSYNVELCQL